LIGDAAAAGADAVVLPYGVFRLTRTAIDSADPAATWPTGAEIHVAPGPEVLVAAPWAGRLDIGDSTGDGTGDVRLVRADGWMLRLHGIVPGESGSMGDVAAGERIGALPAADTARVLRV